MESLLILGLISLTTYMAVEALGMLIDMFHGRR